jgi:hypothetical protein
MGGMSACIVSFEPANATHQGPYITACTLLVVMWLVIVTAWLLADVMQGGCCSTSHLPLGSSNPIPMPLVLHG